MSFTMPQNPNFAVELNSDNTLKLRGYLGSSPILDIPKEIGGHTVTKIAASFCDFNPSVCAVHMPDTIVYIGKGAFYNCANLKKITLSKKLREIPTDFCKFTSLKTLKIPDSVTKIKNGAFQYASNMESVKLGKNLKVIQKNVFNSCNLKEIHLGPKVEYIYLKDGFLSLNPNLEKITVDKDNTHFYDVKGVLFSRDDNMLIRFPPSYLCGRKNNDFYAVPEGTKIIGFSSFAGCELKTIQFPKSIEKIDSCFSFEFIMTKDKCFICEKNSIAEKLAENYRFKVKRPEKGINDFLAEISNEAQSHSL